MKHVTYARKLDDGGYEFGIIIDRWRCLGAYRGVLAHYSEWGLIEQQRQPRGTATDYETARKCMAAIES